MNLLKRLLAVLACAGVMGSAHALDHTLSLGPLAATTAVQAEFYTTPSVTIPYSFADLFNFTLGAQSQLVTAGAVSLAPAGDSAGLMHTSNLTLTLYSGADAGGSVLSTASSAGGAMIGTSDTLGAGSYSAKVTGTADGVVGGGYLFSIAAVPEPAEWMLLLCGLVTIGFIARRRLGGEWPAL